MPIRYEITLKYGLNLSYSTAASFDNSSAFYPLVQIVSYCTVLNLDVYLGSRYQESGYVGSEYLESGYL